MTDVKKKRAGLVAIWIIFVAAVFVLFYYEENHIQDETVRKELPDQAESVANLFPAMLENNYLTEVNSTKMEYAKLKTLSFALDRMEDDEKIKALLDDYVKAADVYGIEIRDRDGKTVFASGEAMNSEIPDSVVKDVLESHLFRDMDEFVTDYEGYRYALLSGYDIASPNEEKQDFVFWSAKNDQWLLIAGTKRVQNESDITNYFSWKRRLCTVSIGKKGFVLATDRIAGKVLSCGFLDLEGRKIDELGICKRGSSQALGFEELKELFETGDQVIPLSLAEQEYYATPVNVDGVFMLAMLPTEEVRKEAWENTGFLVLLFVLVSGVFMVYAFIHLQDIAAARLRQRKHFAWNKTLAGKLKIVSVAALIVILLSGLLHEWLQRYADTFRYSQNKVEEVVNNLEIGKYYLEKLEKMYGEEYLVKCRIAGCLLAHTEHQNVSEAYLKELSEKLGVRYIYIFDRQGKVLTTNSPYDRVNVDRSSPFYVVLQGRSELVTEPEYDEIADDVIQRFAVSLRDKNNDGYGMLMLVADDTEVERLANNMSVDHVFERIGLLNDTFLMRIDAESLIVKQGGQVRDGVYETTFDSSDGSGFTALDLGIDESHLRDRFNGNMKFFYTTYFSSVRRLDDDFMLVMRPLHHLDHTKLLPVVCAAIVLLLFVSAVIVLTCASKRKEDAENAEEDEEELPEPEEKESEADRKSEEEMRQKDDDVIAMLSSFINKNKPYFEQRWPDDSIRWKDKTSDEKFKSAFRIMVILLVVALFAYALVAGENSVWYYCFHGEWERGFNLYSLISCVMIVIVLFISKQVIHKLLFLIARASGSRGETICHLLNSFSGYAFAIAGIFLCLAGCGVNTRALSLTGGVVGVVFGIGCQNIVADILAGILMTFEGVARAGDFVSYNDRFGVILSIGVRTTKLKWFSEITIVRNNDFKNYIYMPSEKQDRVITTLNIDLKESLERVEAVLNEELPKLHDKLCEMSKTEVGGPKYRGVQDITANAVVLSFAIFCKGMYYGWLRRALNRELKLMCERNGINLAAQQVVVHEPERYPDLTVEPVEIEADNE